MKILSRLVWRLLDWFDYRIWDARLRLVDAVHGPEPETEADHERSHRQGPVNAGAAAEVDELSTRISAKPVRDYFLRLFGW